MFKKLLSVEWLLVILAIATAVIPALPISFDPPDDYSMSTISYPEYESPLEDSMPHYLYRHIEDSLNRIKQANDAISSSSHASSLFFNSVGWSKLNDEELRNHGESLAVNDSYYLTLDGYRMEEDAHFKVEDKRWLIEKPVWDVVRKTEDGNHRSGHYESKPVRIRYAVTPEGKLGAGRVLIPISHGQSRFLNIVLWLLIVAGAFLLFWALFAIPLSIIIHIANGKIFSDGSYRRLYFTGWILIAYALLPAVIGWIMRLVFHSMMPQEVHYSIFENLLHNRQGILAGLVVFLIGRAFQRGYELQLDNAAIV